MGKKSGGKKDDKSDDKSKKKKSKKDPETLSKDTERRDGYSLRDALRVPTTGDAGAVREHLQRVNSAATPFAPGNKEDTVAHLEGFGAELADLQQRFYAAGNGGGNQRILLVLQGMDTSGKGGIIEHVMGRVNPNGLRLHSFKSPTKEELEHHFLWRVRQVLPKVAEIGIFDRSHYEDVLIVRVHDLVPEETWKKRYDEINSFEKELADNGTIVIKCFLNVSYDEQRERLIARLDDPTTHWKFNIGDIKERGYWKDYQVAYLDALVNCGSESAPWYSIPADNKWYRNWAIGRILLEALRDLDPQFPKMDLDIPALRAQLAPPN